MPNGPVTVDGVIPPSQPEKQPPPKAAKPPADPAVRRWKALLLLAGGVLYFFFGIWCLFLLSILPSPQVLSELVLAGVVSCIVAGIVFFVIAGLALMHIAKTKSSPRARQIALIKMIAVVIPGLVLAAVTPLRITGEPPIALDITSPQTSEELVAPVLMTFSAERALGVLAQRGFRPVQYQWDLNGDRQTDQETLDPTLSATFDRDGIYTVSVSMRSAGGETRVATKRFIISQAVFAVTPNVPIVEQPVIFSLDHLYPNPADVVSVSWDFDTDGKEDEKTQSTQVTHTFIRTGISRVSALVELANKTQARFERVIDIQNPPELPFPVKIVSQPENLIGIPPFPALFRIETEEPLYGVQWNFGDGQKAEGEMATHTFTQKGNYVVQATVRSQSGVIAEVSSIVKVVDRLDLPDLRFEGTPSVQGNRITGEVPLTLDLRPVTQKAFVQFNWEAPEATEVGSTQERLQAIFRRPGTYTVTLVAQDLENHVMRLPITVEVKPPSSLITINMDPESGVAPLSVKFDASETSIPGEDITGFIWNFGDGSPQEFGGSLTQHTYRTAGTYVVNLTVRTTSGKQQGTTRTLVVRAPVLQALILASRLRGPAPLTVDFDASSTTGDIASYLWNFGDGTQNDGPKATHTFVSPGTYTVQMTATDISGKPSTASVSITVE